MLLSAAACSQYTGAECKWTAVWTWGVWFISARIEEHWCDVSLGLFVSARPPELGGSLTLSYQGFRSVTGAMPPFALHTLSHMSLSYCPESPAYSPLSDVVPQNLLKCCAGELNSVWLKWFIWCYFNSSSSHVSPCYSVLGSSLQIHWILLAAGENPNVGLASGFNPVPCACVPCG